MTPSRIVPAAAETHPTRPDESPEPVEAVVWPPRAPSEQLMRILRRGLRAGESLVGPDGRWAVRQTESG